jgi:hypothetical protein
MPLLSVNPVKAGSGTGEKPDIIGEGDY